ncbi:Mov34-domain-containing protein [Cucurbitaria berberidis CBS 394.84]|uniref:COP9 signalosome complex subunit 5 n=1 Tax=Cucurbitaria berberidis CBS 394.84 TaxID=1168544 RepID=A0A9P4LCB7_9PLEO|nr:Mov34-domain-containing protein [Cucurbitaria berberidis CBS 394.84]KAF1849548.1 Mov34-domain-containing protein [Cucurbitaria berberidis CBS 394.84]
MGTALKTWELENSVKLVDPTKDALYSYSASAQKSINEAHPWRTDPNYFTSVRISAVALLKMVMHARSGGSLEVMGLMLGKIEAHTFVVTDAFRLPVEGTETRVNAQDEANEYMVEFLARAREQGQSDNAVGWYHSHPGYGCWLSGIDVNTQKTQQQFQDPFCAIVIDPDRTVSAGKVEIGAFRTYSTEYMETNDKTGGSSKSSGGGGVDSDGFQTIPLGKIEDFGAHANHYYSLEVTHYKSSLDAKLLEALWNKYWVQTLSSSPLISNRDYGTKQISDLARKTQQESKNGKRFKSGPGHATRFEVKGQLAKLGAAGSKIAREEDMGLLAAQVKDKVFNLNGDDQVTTESQEVEMKT